MPIRPEKRSAPNYSSRSMRLRLMMLVAALMLVLVAMDEARKPENWAWMGFKPKTEAPVSLADSEVSPRLVDLFSPPSESNSLFEAMARSTISDDQDDSQTEEARLVLEGTLERVLLPVFRSLNNDQRWLFTLIMDSVSRGESWDGDDEELRIELSKRVSTLSSTVIERLWEEARRAAVADLPPSESAVDLESLSTPWDSLLTDMKSRFELVSNIVEQGTFPLDATVGDIERVSEAAAAWDQVLLGQIEDLSMGLRKDEVAAWFRMAQQLRRWQASGESPRPATVSDYELSQQPDLYRGKWVRLRGEVRRVERAAAPESFEELAPSWLLLIRPAYGPDNVLSVYCMDLPDGFPRPEGDVSFLDIREPVEIEAAFFKREGYQASDVTRVTPRLIGIGPEWTKAAEVSGASSEINGWTLGGIILINLLIAVGVAYWAARSTRLRKRESSESAGAGLKIGLWLLLAMSFCWGGASDSIGQELPPWLLSDEAEKQALPEARQLFADWPRSELDRLGDALPLTTNEPLGFEILERLAAIGPFSLQAASVVLDADRRSELLQAPASHRLEAMVVRGKLESVEILELDELTASEFDREVVYRLVLGSLEESGASFSDNSGSDLISRDERTVVWCDQIPSSWLEGVPVGDEIEVTGVFLRLERVEEGSENDPVPLLLCVLPQWLGKGEGAEADSRSAWLEFGIDRGLWDQVARANGMELTAGEGRSLYRVLRAAREITGHADTALLPDALPLDLFRLLDKGEAHLGERVRFEGRIKRISEIGTGNDLFARDAGISRYFQIDMLVSLQGNEVRLQSKENTATLVNTYPLTLCMVDLPEGMEPGPELDVAVWVEGIYYRNWRYQSAYLRDVDPTLRQVAPLIIGWSVESTGVESEGKQMLTTLAAIFCVVGLGGTMLVFGWLKWSDRRSYEKAAEAKKAVLPERIEVPLVSTPSSPEETQSI